MQKAIQIGNSKMPVENRKVAGDFVKVEGEFFYKISNSDLMPPFFMTIVSHSDHWMFVSSNGGLTAGRKNPDNALFPYYTVDKVVDGAVNTGSKTVLIVRKNDTSFLWEPFSVNYNGIYKIKRNIYKSVLGNKILFEEINEDLEVTFSYQWMSTEQFGFVRRSCLLNSGVSELEVSLLDGIQNILPAGIDRMLQLSYSNLVDAYKKSELIEGSSIALYMLSSVIVDKAEPSEALQANVVWSSGLENARILLSETQLDRFRNGQDVITETDMRASRGCYLVNAEITLPPASTKKWMIIADVNKDAGDIAWLKNFMNSATDVYPVIKNGVEEGNIALTKILAAADGLQLTNDQLSVTRHLSNVLFNVMRGGIPADNYTVDKTDLLQFISSFNKKIAEENSKVLDSLREKESYGSLLDKINSHNHPQLIRLVYEYLPITFSRRHGDPSRPWNQFSIELKNEDGTDNLYYAGNWRDIFQNWEALSLSYPSFIEGMICKFVNASTADGYNPYRITRDGIDWEKPDPHDPWANIGYWGDHQIIYLLKFLEISKNHHPGKIAKLLSQKIFAYANVPYRIKSYEALLNNPFDTIDFSEVEDEKINLRVTEIGADGKLLWDTNGNVQLVNLTEKILAIVLAKLSNFIPETGIWLNTQRPEWNDANNALVGNGVSMVTLYYLRRFQKFCLQLLNESTEDGFEISSEMNSFLQTVSASFSYHKKVLASGFSDEDRKLMVDELGTAGSEFREQLYSHGFSDSSEIVERKTLLDFFSLTLEFIDQSIQKNKRPDGLYHAYNLISIQPNAIQVKQLYEMLEGQVAVLSSGLLNAAEVVQVLDSLKASSLFRQDQYSYLLYPDRQLARFMDKNVIPEKQILRSTLCQKLLADENKSIIYRDVDSKYHFNSSFRNAADLEKALDSLGGYIDLVGKERSLLLKIFESVFDHQSFTGRSGTFYGFEGLGCIYWHMVSKLLLAINENYFKALHEHASKEVLDKLVTHYYDVRAGIGLNKSPELFGAFPTDAYSHTPGNGGAKQPGMTGQVKEDIISRFGELGVDVVSGKICFNPGLLRKSEFIRQAATFRYFNVDNEEKIITLPENALVFTLCQVPIIFIESKKNKIVIQTSKNEMDIEGLQINETVSAEIFGRSGKVNKIQVYLQPRLN